MKAINELSILLVEDDIKLCENIGEYLETLFLKIYSAHNGKDALEIYKTNHVDLVLSDIRMPIMDGLELTKNIKQLNQHTPVILMTAFSNEESMRESINIGVDQYVLKPINIEQLEHALNVAVDLINIKELEIQKEKLYLEEAIINSKASLLRDVSHHWKNPLNVISASLIVIEMTLLEEIADEKKRAEVALKMHKVEEITTNLANTINNFQRFFSYNDNKEHFKIYDHLQESINHCFNDENKTVYIEVSKEKTLYENISSFHTVVCNILGNALDATQNQAKKIIKITDKSDMQDYYSITLEDQGEGFSEESLVHACEPYYSQRYKASGRGLGLFVAKQIMEREFNGKLLYGNHKDGAFVTLLFPNQ